MNGSDDLFRSVLDALKQSRVGGNSITGIVERLHENGYKDLHRLYLTGFLEAMVVGGALVRIDIASAHFFFLPEYAKRFAAWHRSMVPVKKGDLTRYQRVMQEKFGEPG